MGQAAEQFDYREIRNKMSSSDRSDDRPKNYNTNFKSVRDEVSAEEWQARVDLAACYRLVDLYGMAGMIYNHITVRVPGTDVILINMYGMTYKEITASSLMKIDLEGNVIAKPESDYGLNVAGYIIHSAVHSARSDVNCVIHTHTTAGTAVSAMKTGLLPMSQESARFYQHIGYHDYEGPAFNPEERKRLVEHLGQNNAMILRSHGLLTCGASIPEAFNLMWQLEMSCREQVAATAGGKSEILIPPENVVAKTADVFQPGSLRRYGVLEWPAMIRRLEAELANNGYPYYAS